MDLQAAELGADPLGLKQKEVTRVANTSKKRENEKKYRRSEEYKKRRREYVKNKRLKKRQQRADNEDYAFQYDCLGFFPCRVLQNITTKKHREALTKVCKAAFAGQAGSSWADQEVGLSTGQKRFVVNPSKERAKIISDHKEDVIVLPVEFWNDGCQEALEVIISKVKKVVDYPGFH